MIAAVRPLASLGLQASAARSNGRGQGEKNAFEPRDLSSGVDWQLSRGWHLWAGGQSSESDCGAGCTSLMRSLDAQISRDFDLAVRGTKLPAKFFTGGSQQRVASANAGSGFDSSDDYWSVGAGLSVTF